ALIPCGYITRPLVAGLDRGVVRQRLRVCRRRLEAQAHSLRGQLRDSVRGGMAEDAVRVASDPGQAVIALVAAERPGLRANRRWQPWRFLRSAASSSGLPRLTR